MNPSPIARLVLQQIATSISGDVLFRAAEQSNTWKRLTEGANEEVSQAGLELLKVFCQPALWVSQHDFLEQSTPLYWRLISLGASPSFGINLTLLLEAELTKYDNSALERADRTLALTIWREAMTDFCLTVAANKENDSAPRKSSKSQDLIVGLGENIAKAPANGMIGLLGIAVEWSTGLRSMPVELQESVVAKITAGLRETVRSMDTVFAVHENEWCIIIPNLKSPAQLALASNKLLNKCKNILPLSDRRTLGVFYSGSAIWPQDGDSPVAARYAMRTSLLLARHRNAPYLAYQHDFAASVKRMVALESEFIEALEQRDLQIYLQPQVQSSDGHCVSSEALLRWQTRSGQWVPPPQIIEIAEQLGLLPDLSRWLITSCARMVSAMHERGMAIRICLNLTASDMRDVELPDLVGQVLDLWRVPEGALGLEITESALVSDEAQAEAIIQRLRLLGCRVALDDFGTGYSSLAYLRGLSVSELKIDQLFVRQMRTSERDRVLVDVMARMAHGFNLEVVVEGVEDIETFYILREMHCHLIQGYLVARPMCEDDFTTWYQKNGAGQWLQNHAAPAVSI